MLLEKLYYMYSASYTLFAAQGSCTSGDQSPAEQQRSITMGSDFAEIRRKRSVHDDAPLLHTSQANALDCHDRPRT